jgi:DNA helicase HerA-like ATPase
MAATERISIEGQQLVVCGHRGAGKSTWIQHAVHDAPVFVYDMNREHEAIADRPNGARYLPNHRRDEEGRAEADGVVSRLVTDNEPGARPAVVVLEEANRYVPNAGKIPEAVGELVDLGRHYKTAASDGIAVMYVTRRPAQLDPDVMELADYLIVYRVRGKNDKKRLNKEAPNLGDRAAELGEYEWLLVHPDRTITHMSPVPEGDTTGSL